MPRGLRTAPLGSLEVPGDPYSLRVLQEGYCTPRPDGTVLADGSVTLVWGGPVTALVDTGGPWGRQRLLDRLAAAGVAPEAVTHVVCTHGHSDHVGNLNLFPRATLVLGLDVSRPDGAYVPHRLARGEALVLHEGLLEVVATPGHTRAHVSLVVRGTRLGTAVVAGDLFEREGDDREWGALSEDPAEQERSRRQVLGLADVIVPGHGPPFRVFRAGADGEGAAGHRQGHTEQGETQGSTGAAAGEGGEPGAGGDPRPEEQRLQDDPGDPPVTPADPSVPPVTSVSLTEPR